MNLCPLHSQQKGYLCLFASCPNEWWLRVRGSNGQTELGWDEEGGWSAAFGPSFTLSALLAGDSVQDLLITTQWSGNPTDLIDSNCCLGLTALPNPPSMPLYFSQSLIPSPPSLINHWYAWRPWGPMKEGCSEDWRDSGCSIKCVYTQHKCLWAAFPPWLVSRFLSHQNRWVNDFALLHTSLLTVKCFLAPQIRMRKGKSSLQCACFQYWIQFCGEFLWNLFS